MKKFLIFFIALLEILSAKPGYKKDYAPEFALFDVNNKFYRLSNKKFKNKIIIINFFTTWCLPCREEIPDFVDIYNRYKDKGVMIIGILLEKDKKIKEFIKAYHIPYPVLYSNKQMIKEYGGINVIPTTFILNYKKVIVDKIIGRADKDKLINKIERLIKIREAFLKRK